MTEARKVADDDRHETYEFDLSKLTKGYTNAFLLSLKNLLIERRKRVALVSVRIEYANLRSLFEAAQTRKLMEGQTASIDEAYLLAVQTTHGSFSTTGVATLKRLYLAYRTSPLFSTELKPSDFVTNTPTKGVMGQITARILVRALTRAACVEVLRTVEDAFEAGDIEIDLFSFIHLAFHLFCRPQSYCRLTLADLHIDEDPTTGVRTHFLWVQPAKSGMDSPKKLSYKLNRLVGELLERQRIHVIAKFGHLARDGDVTRLALFPSKRIGADGQWYGAYAREHHGEIRPGGFSTSYLRPIVGLCHSVKLTFNALRHTVGTQLAEAGCSAQTIAAVLKHASDQTCHAYVDIAFHGLQKNLSDVMEPAFSEHFPVFAAMRSKADQVEPQKAIRSESVATGEIELTGECGRTIACQYAPLACYACPRFIPCYDADHSINLDAIDREIGLAVAGGPPFKHLLDRAKDSRRHIIVVIAASEQWRTARTEELHG